MNTLNQRKERAYQLAKDILRVENSIQAILDSGDFNFDIHYDEDFKSWLIQTGFCQMGGCLYDYIEADTEEKARRIAAEMTYFGEESYTGGLCSDCQREYYEMII